MKEKINEILMSNNLNENSELILEYIPELKNMVGFEHRHPHHHLDVWNHTLAVVGGLENSSLDTKMAGLLHDVGKPFSYQDDEVRHFHGHPQVSAKMAKEILIRLGYDNKFVEDVYYLVKTHDSIINPDKLDNTSKMIEKRLELQYADAKAHSPDKVQKRLDFLDEINNRLKEEKELL